MRGSVWFTAVFSGQDSGRTPSRQHASPGYMWPGAGNEAQSEQRQPPRARGPGAFCRLPTPCCPQSRRPHRALINRVNGTFHVTRGLPRCSASSPAGSSVRGARCLARGHRGRSRRPIWGVPWGAAALPLGQGWGVGCVIAHPNNWSEVFPWRH